MATSNSRTSRRSDNGSTTSKLTLKSIRSTAGQIPSTKACPWVAQWFTIPQAVLKLLQLGAGLSAAVLLLVWESEGVHITNLNRETVNYRNIIYSYAGLALLQVFYSMGMTTLGFGGLKLPPFMQILFAGVLFGMWLLVAPVMSVSIIQLNNTLFARSRGLNTLCLDIATIFGFVSLVACLGDILLAFMTLRELDEDSNEFSQELSQSRSILMAVRSGRSLQEAKKRTSPVPTKSPHAANKPVDELSPLKSHEELPSSEDEAAA